MAVGAKPIDQFNHLRDMIGGAQDLFRPFPAQGVEVLEEILQIFVGVIAQTHLFSRRSRDDLVIDIGDVHDVMKLIAAILEISTEQIGEKEGPKVADMCKIIDRRAADVDPDARRIERVEIFGFARERIVEFEHAKRT